MNAQPIERWRPVPRYEGRYEVSDLGRVLSLPRPRVRQTRLLNPTPDAGGYPTVHLRGKDARGRTFRVHELVMLAFVGPRPAWSAHIRHLDGNSLNCRLENLAYGTVSENIFDQVDHGTHPEASKTECSNGHPFDEDNTYRIPSRPRSRYCRACQADNRNRRRAAQRAAGIPVP